jgi:hypothetical protein
MTCCYHRSTCLYVLLYLFSFFSVGILTAIVIFTQVSILTMIVFLLKILFFMFKISDERYRSSTEYPTTTPVGIKNCEIVVRNTLWVIQSGLLLILFLISMHSAVVRCQQRCQRNVHSTPTTA